MWSEWSRFVEVCYSYSFFSNCYFQPVNIEPLKGLRHKIKHTNDKVNNMIEADNLKIEKACEAAYLE
jgi:hypothetical protein